MGALLRVTFVVALTFACLSSLHAASPPRKLALPNAAEIDASSIRVLQEYDGAAADSSADSPNLDIGGFYASGGGEEEEAGAMMDNGEDDSRRELFGWGDIKSGFQNLGNKINNAANDVKNKVNAAANDVKNKVNAAANDVKNKVNVAGQHIGKGAKHGFEAVKNVAHKVATDKELQKQIITTVKTTAEVAKTVAPLIA